LLPFTGVNLDFPPHVPHVTTHAIGQLHSITGAYPTALRTMTAHAAFCHCTASLCCSRIACYVFASQWTCHYSMEHTSLTLLMYRCDMPASETTGLRTWTVFIALIRILIFCYYAFALTSTSTPKRFRHFAFVYQTLPWIGQLCRTKRVGARPFPGRTRQRAASYGLPIHRTRCIYLSTSSACHHPFWCSERRSGWIWNRSGT